MDEGGGGHSPFKPLLGQIKIAKAATQKMCNAEYIKVCMVWKTGKEVFWEKSHFMKYPVYFFFFIISGKSMKQELLEMVQVIVLIFFILMKSENEGDFYMYFYTGILYKICIWKIASKKALIPSFLISSK